MSAIVERLPAWWATCAECEWARLHHEEVDAEAAVRAHNNMVHPKPTD